MSKIKYPIDLTGFVFGSLTVVSKIRGPSANKSSVWLCQCSCGNCTRVRRCHLVSGHTNTCGCSKYRRVPLKERILRKIVVDEDTGCWKWKGNVATNGYGTLGVGSRTDRSRKTEYAHRASYIAFVDQIPEGKELDHLCRNRDCVNPDHLDPVTRRENIMRGDGPKKFGLINSMKTHCLRGHLFDEVNTYYRPSGGRVCRECTRVRRRK
jgi:hypothetical protein